MMKEELDFAMIEPTTGLPCAIMVGDASEKEVANFYKLAAKRRFCVTMMPTSEAVDKFGQYIRRDKQTQPKQEELFNA